MLANWIENGARFYVLIFYLDPEPFRSSGFIVGTLILKTSSFSRSRGGASSISLVATQLTPVFSQSCPLLASVASMVPVWASWSCTASTDVPCLQPPHSNSPETAACHASLNVTPPYSDCWRQSQAPESYSLILVLTDLEFSLPPFHILIFYNEQILKFYSAKNLDFKLRYMKIPQKLWQLPCLRFPLIPKLGY